MAVLLASEHVTCAAQFKVECSNAEARAQLAELFHRGKPFARDFGENSLRRNEQVRISALMGTANPAAQLVKLSQAETIRTIDQDGVGVRDVQAIFDDCGGDKYVRFPANKL